MNSLRTNQNDALEAVGDERDVEPGDRLRAAEEQRHDDAAHRDRVHELGEEEQGEAERRVLGVEPADELLLGLDEVERRPVELGRGGDHEDDERARSRSATMFQSARASPARRRCPHVDSVPDEQQHGGDAQTERGLVADHLRRRPHRAEQRVLRAARPAGEHDAVDGDRATGPGPAGCRSAGRRAAPWSRGRTTSTMPSLPSLKSPPSGMTDHTRNAGTKARNGASR